MSKCSLKGFTGSDTRRPRVPAAGTPVTLREQGHVATVMFISSVQVAKSPYQIYKLNVANIITALEHESHTIWLFQGTGPRLAGKPRNGPPGCKARDPARGSDPPRVVTSYPESCSLVTHANPVPTWVPGRRS